MLHSIKGKYRVIKKVFNQINMVYTMVIYNGI